MKKYILFIFTCVILFGCGKKEETSNALFSTSNNKDSANFWMNINTITKGTAHTGYYASKLDTLFQFGIGLNPKVKDLTDKTPKKVTVKCWVYSTTPNLEASIVCDPIINGEKLGWKNFDFKPVIKKANEWTEVIATFDLPKNITPDTELGVYIWNPNKLMFFVDDFEFSIE
jgi:hypothetical protein